MAVVQRNVKLIRMSGIKCGGDGGGSADTGTAEL
jgi:hypothetical protein